MFIYILYHNFNNSLFSKVFPKLIYHPPLKKTKKFWKIITDLLAFCQVSQKPMNVLCTIMFNHFFQNCNLDFEKDLMRNTAYLFNSSNQKLIGTLFNNKFDFNKYVISLCRKVSQKLNALPRVAHYMNVAQRRLIMNAFILSQFGYCPLVWMFHNRKLNNRINNIHERALRVVFRDCESTF